MKKWKWLSVIVCMAMLFQVVWSVGTNQTDIAEAVGNQGNANLIYNGDFELGNVGFITEQGTYGIYSSLNLCFTNNSLADHTFGNGKYMYIDQNPDISKFVWKQGVSESIVGGKQYTFKAYLASTCGSNRPLLEFQISKDGNNWTSLAPAMRLTNDITWNLYEAKWTAPSDGTYQIRLMNYESAGYGNDFAVDDIYFGLAEAESTVWPNTPKLVVNNLNYPQGIAVDSKGNMYVSGSNSTIIKINSNGNIIGSYGSGNCPGFNGSLGILCFPKGIAVDQNDIIYIADTYNNRIQIMDTNGNFIGKIGNVTYPHDIAIANNGNFLIPDSSYYLVEQGNSVSLENYIDILDDNRDLITKMGSNGSNPGQFNLPESIAIDSAGNIFVADAKNHRIQKFDSNRNFLMSWGGIGTLNGEFNSPSGIAIDKIGNVFIADRLNNRIQVFDNSGNYLGQVGTSGCSGESGSICRPNDLTIGPDGSLYVVEDRNIFSDGGQANFQNRIEVFDIKSVTTPVSGVTVNKITNPLNPTQTFQLTATVTPANASNKTVTWSSSNPAVATVNANGLVTAVGNGTATITVTTTDGNKTTTANVNVSTPLTGVSLDKNTLSLNLTKNSQLTATVSPNTATIRAITWTSSNTAVATVSSSGIVTAVSNGTATITATTKVGGYTATTNVTVTTPVTGLSASVGSLTLNEGQSNKITATVSPTTASNQSVTWRSLDNSIASVDQTGNVTAGKPGTTYITAQTEDGSYKARIAVTVNIAVRGVSIFKPALAVIFNSNQEMQLVPFIRPINATNQALTWTSSNPFVATVDQTGKIKALRTGNATITVTTVDGSFSFSLPIKVR